MVDRGVCWGAEAVVFTVPMQTRTAPGPSEFRGSGGLIGSQGGIRDRAPPVTSTYLKRGWKA